ncbi:hypothetical protein A3715_16390 [Oleiphilus sp. HI0009]
MPLYSFEYYDQKEDGWHFYNEFFPEEPVENLQPPAPPKPDKKPEEKKEETIKPSVTASIPSSSVEPGSSEWIRTEYPKILDHSIDNPSYENVRRTAYIQRLAVDKSDKFSQMWERVHATDPFLDENRRRPQANYLRAKIGAQMRIHTDKLIKRFNQDFAYFFFFEKDCVMCGYAAQHLAEIERRYGATIVAVSLDGEPPQFPYFKDTFIKDSGQSKLLNIIQTPMVYGFHNPTKKWAPLFAGVLTYERIVMKTLLIAHTNNWITDQQFEPTKFRQVNDMLVSSDEQDEFDDEYSDQSTESLYQDLLLQAGHKL